jgi:hypothetical protein
LLLCSFLFACLDLCTSPVRLVDDSVSRPHSECRPLTRAVCSCSLRAMFAQSDTENAVHGSDRSEAVQHSIHTFFPGRPSAPMPTMPQCPNDPNHHPPSLPGHLLFFIPMGRSVIHMSISDQTLLFQQNGLRLICTQKTPSLSLSSPNVRWFVIFASLFVVHSLCIPRA